VFDPKNRIHWVAVVVIAIILILILGVTATASGQEPRVWGTPADSDPGPCGEQPVYLPRDTEPRFTDQAALRDYLVELQTEERPEIGGRTILWVCISATGHVNGVLVHTTSGDPILDSIALRVIAGARYTPATNRGQTTTVWIAQPVDFIPRIKAVDL
jgi:TonB family protein